MKTLRQFENMQDPFNENNYLTGLIDINQGDNYGQLILTHINGVSCENQTIFSTPKMHYPFNKNGKFYFNFLDDCLIYDKIDGTNVISYNYIFEGKRYTTYKTRLSPVLREGRFGNFFSMWKEMLKKYPEIGNFAEKYDINFSYELYGVINKHLILYPIRLDTRLLFGIDYYTGNIILPDKFKNDIPVVEKTDKIHSKDFFPEYYKKLQDKIENNNDYSVIDEVKGSEGRVFYIRIDDTWKQYKLKPKTIFSLHCKSGISKNDIMTTCYNALENTDNLTYSFIVELLKEEFSTTEINSSEYRIKKIMEEVMKELKQRELIIKVYNDAKIKLKDNKGMLMRKMSEFFDKKEIRYVYSIIEAFENK